MHIAMRPDTAALSNEASDAQAQMGDPCGGGDPAGSPGRRATLRPELPGLHAGLDARRQHHELQVHLVGSVPGAGVRILGDVPGQPLLVAAASSFTARATAAPGLLNPAHDHAEQRCCDPTITSTGRGASCTMRSARLPRSSRGVRVSAAAPEKHTLITARPVL